MSISIFDFYDRGTSVFIDANDDNEIFLHYPPSMFADIHQRETLIDVPSAINVTDACRITEVGHCLNCAHSAANTLVTPGASLSLLMLVLPNQRTRD